MVVLLSGGAGKRCLGDSRRWQAREAGGRDGIVADGALGSCGGLQKRQQLLEEERVRKQKADDEGDKHKKKRKKKQQKVTVSFDEEDELGDDDIAESDGELTTRANTLSFLSFHSTLTACPYLLTQLWQKRPR